RRAGPDQEERSHRNCNHRKWFENVRGSGPGASTANRTETLGVRRNIWRCVSCRLRLLFPLPFENSRLAQTLFRLKPEPYRKCSTILTPNIPASAPACAMKEDRYAVSSISIWMGKTFGSWRTSQRP